MPDQALPRWRACIQCLWRWLLWWSTFYKYNEVLLGKLGWRRFEANLLWSQRKSLFKHVPTCLRLENCWGTLWVMYWTDTAHALVLIFPSTLLIFANFEASHCWEWMVFLEACWNRSKRYLQMNCCFYKLQIGWQMACWKCSRSCWKLSETVLMGIICLPIVIRTPSSRTREAIPVIMG